MINLEKIEAVAKSVHEESPLCELTMGGYIMQLISRIRELENDYKIAAGELRVPIPEPGTEAARMLIANRLLMRERDVAREVRDRALVTLDKQAKEIAEVHDQMEILSKINNDHQQRMREIEARIHHAEETLAGKIQAPSIDELRKIRGLEPLSRVGVLK